ncbi:MAG: hypothetical protein ABI113_00590, partial [Mucilaginibacter sp.]
QNGCFATAALDAATHELIIKMVNSGKEVQKVDFLINGVIAGSNGTLTLLQSDDLQKVNSLNEPLAISPKTSEIALNDNHIKLSLKPYSFNVIRVKIVK